MNTSFTYPQQLYKYNDGSLRIITYDDLKQGDNIEYNSLKWVTEKGIVSEIVEKKISAGEFNSEVPFSYRLFLNVENL